MIRKTLLLVEDEPLIAISIEDLLAREGFIVLVAHSGAEALSLLETTGTVIAGLITDIRCGAGADGWLLARRGRELNPYLPVVYISGDSAYQHRSHGVPDSLMVAKPFTPSEIIAAISALLPALPSAMEMIGKPSARGATDDE